MAILGPGDIRLSKTKVELLLAWNHKDEILAKESEFTARGGKWITFVPEVAVI